RSDNPACTIDGSTLTCPLGTVDPAETQSIEVTGTVTQHSGETFTVSAAVGSNDPDWPEIDPGDNQTSLSVPVTANVKILDLRFDEETLGVLIAKSAGPNTLTLSELPNHQSIRISFDLYIIGEWQGNPWALSADGRTLLNTSFSNDPDYCQAYPANLPGCSSPAQRGAVGINELEYEEKPDSRYHLTYRFAHSDDEISWIFDAPDMPDEAEWGLDNLVVEVDNGQTKVYLPMVVTSK
ncbi:MAG TPA: hypothetical protein VFF68_05695, partial [Anaerolineaceae bacterium]|nr:hypothetical protein [Anaerolineaceae bacterium]